MSIPSNSSLERNTVLWDFWYHLTSDDDNIIEHCVQAAMLTVIKWLPYYCKMFYNFTITFLCCKINKKKRKHFFNQNLYLMIFFSWKLQCYLMHRLFFPNKRNRIYYFSTHFFLIFYLKNFLKNMKDKIQPLSNFHRINFDVHWWRNTEKKV